MLHRVSKRGHTASTDRDQEIKRGRRKKDGCSTVEWDSEVN